MGANKIKKQAERLEALERATDGLSSGADSLDNTPLPEWAVSAAFLYLTKLKEGMPEDEFARTYVTEYQTLRRALAGLPEHDEQPQQPAPARKRSRLL